MNNGHALAGPPNRGDHPRRPVDLPLSQAGARAALRRFDAQNRARLEAEQKDRGDQLAHFRHTLKRAEEQVDDIGEITLSDVKTGTAVTRYTFEGERFATRLEAEHARADKVRALARKFYMALFFRARRTALETYG